MPIGLCRAATVLSPNGLILLGGQERNGSKVRITDIILEIKENNSDQNQSLEWKIIPQTLHMARSTPIAILIPDELTSCSNTTSTSTLEESMELEEKLTRSNDFFTSLKISLIIIICGIIISIFAFIIGKKYYYVCYKKDDENSADIDHLLVPLTKTNYLFEENAGYYQSSDICKIPLSSIQVKTELGMRHSSEIRGLCST